MVIFYDTISNMKILISADTYYPHVNGASYFAQRLAHYLQKRGHEIAVIAPSQKLGNTKELVNDIKVYGVISFPVFFYPGVRFSFPIFIKKYLQKAIQEFQPDIVHLQSHFILGRYLIKICGEKNIPVVATNHFMPENLVHYLPAPAFVKNAVSALAWFDFARIFNQAGQITTPTESAADLIRHFFRTPIKAISCGIDFQRFNPKNNGEYLKKRYKIPDRPILLYVGRLDKEKNLDLVIRAVAEASKQLNFQFVAAGTGAEKNNLINLAKDLGVENKITFAGFVPDDDLPNLYAIADCFIIAGTAELQSIVTMEAMASGLPILGVNAVALPELVKDGQNGFLFDYGNVNGLSKKMALIFSDKNLRDKMGKESLKLITRHEIEKSIKEFEDIYAGEINKYRA